MAAMSEHLAAPTSAELAAIGADVNSVWRVCSDHIAYALCSIASISK